MYSNLNQILSWFPDWRLQSIYLVLYTESIVETVAKE